MLGKNVFCGGGSLGACLRLGRPQKNSRESPDSLLSSEGEPPKLLTQT